MNFWLDKWEIIYLNNYIVLCLSSFKIKVMQIYKSTIYKKYEYI